MSESEVSQIRDEDVLRRMWQQTEDFSRKKEIRAHMYRLREERLRNLYSPEPMSDGKGCEFTSAQGHVKSFADQTFQSMKSKEVRDAGSPPKEFTYRGQDLKELSNAGWNVESENRTTDDGHTHVKSVNANIEGRYDVEGGRGQFAAVDRQRQAVTEYHDDDSSLRHDETSSDTAAHEHVVRQTDDGTRITSTTSSSNTSSKIQQVSSTKHETVPYVTDEDYDRRYSSHDSKRDDRVTKITNKNDYEQTLRRNDYDNAELVSRKVEYPDSNTKVIVETRCLPDGTRVTSTRREFRVPAQSTRSESYQSRNESKSYSSQHKSDTRDSTSKVTRHTIEDRTNDIVDSQRNVDDSDFKRQIREYTVQDNDDYSNTQKRHVTNTDRKVSDYSQTDDDYSQTRYETRTNKKVVDLSTTNKNDYTQTQRHVVDRRNDKRVDEVDWRQATITRDQDIQHKGVKEIHRANDSEEKIHNITMDTKDTATRVHDTTMREQTDIDETNNVPRDGKVSYDRTRDVSRDQNTPRDKETPRNIPKEAKSPYNRNRDISLDDVSTEKKVTEKRGHKIARDEKVEEVVERKTSSDHYQTTYQNDFQNRKISTDFSPTHQAWASSLRSDTPTTRPSTRASSPGSRTFKSSTSSLRSSVSPDKISRKPSSRGGSPNKVDRYSPTRTITSDHYSSTHSTQSINETRTNKNTSPERKPPTGRSPDRKSHDFHRQRPSASPEKRSQNFGDRPNTSPERKPSQKREISPTTKGDIPRSPVGPRQSLERKSNTSPQRKPTDGYPNHSSPRPSPSPERKSDKHTSINKHTDTYSRSPATRSSPSPDRKPGYGIPIETTGYLTSFPSKPQYPSDVHQKSSKSPDRMPDYERPEITKEKPDENRPKDFISKRPSVSPDTKPGYMKPTIASQPDTRKQSNPIDELNRKSPTKQASPDRKPTDVSKTTKIKEDHYRIVDEETKINTQVDNVDTNVKSTTIIKSSPETPSDDSPECGVSPDETDESPSLKNLVVNTEVYGRVDKIDKMTDITAKQDKQTQDIFSVIHSPNNKESPTNKDVTSRETSPPKYGTYDKKKPRDHMTAEVTAVTTEDTKDVKYNSTRQNKTPVSDVQLSPGKKSLRDSTSPLKSPAKDTKYKQTTDFLTSEKKTEELYKKKTTKDHSRQLITPSSSPTRKPKVAETEPSTGQSSPTTSVSGFVYFGSPRTEKPMVTDLDEVYPETENLNQTPTTRPDTLDVNRSPSPSKIPCRSPSPEKHVPTTKDSLPRKSSLKKPTTDLNLTSPIEKPPTNFRISPSDEKPNIPEHNVTKKYHSQEPETGESETGELDSVKPKPPLQRRETYEDRCKKILGMVDDTNNSKSITKETTRYTKKSGSNQSSPSVSPCDSPAPKETTPLADHQTKKKDTIHADFKIDVTDFISREQEHIIKTTDTGDKPKTLSRETSPAELQDITRKTSLTINKTTQASDMTTTKPSQSLDDKPSRSSMSPDRKPVDIKYPRDTSPRKQSPEKSIGRSSITASVTSQYEEISKTDEVEQMTPIAKTTKKSKPTRVLESPTRQIPKSAHDLADKSTEQPRTTSPSRSYPKDGSPDRKRKQPEGSHPDNVTPSKPRQVTDHTPGFTKPTAATTFKIESSTSEDMEETHISKTRVKKASVNTSPIRQTSPEILRSTSPTKLSQPSEISPKRPDSSQQGKNYTAAKKTKSESDQPRTPSPTKQTRLSDISPERKSSKQQPTTQPKRPSESSPSRSKHAKPTETTTKTVTSTSKFDRIDYDSVIQETITSTTKNVSNTRDLKSPTRKAPKTIDVTQRTPEKQDVFLERKPNNQHPSKTSSQEPTDKHPQTPRSASPSKTPGYMKTTTSVTSKFDTTEFSNQDTETIRHQRSLSPSTPTDKRPKISTSPERKPIIKSPVKDAHLPEDENLKDSLGRSSISPDKPSYMKPTASVISKFESSSTTSQDTQETLTSEHRITSQKRTTESPTRKSPEGELKDKNQYISKPDDEPRKLKTPSYMKTTTSVTSKFETTEFSNQDTETIRHQRSLSPSTPTDKRPKISTSPERKPIIKSPVKDAHLPEDENLKDSLGRSSISPDKPSYMKPTASVISKFESSSTTSQDTQETLTSEHRITSQKRTTESPTRKSPEGELKDKNQYISKPDDEPRKLKTPSYMKTTTSVTSKFETTEFSNQDTGTIRHQRSLSPSTSTDKQPKISSSPERKPTMKCPVKDAHVPEDENLKHKLERSSVSPDKPSYMKPTASVISKFESTTSQDTQETLTSEHRTTSQKRATESPTRISPEGELKDKNQYISKPDDEPRRLRTPSPIKHTSKITEVNNEFIVSEREQEILNKVQKSLRKLSPERKEKSPTREKSPTKSTTSLQDLDIVTFETDKVTSEDLSQIVEEHISYKSDMTQPRKLKPITDNKASSKPSSRTVSPTKKTQTTSPNKVDKSPESSSKSRSISPKKPISHAERPQSPLVPRLSGIKPREQIPTHFTRKATPTTFTTVKIEKVTEVKKTNGATKQGVFNKTSNSKIVSKSIPSPTAKSSEPESKRISTSKGVKESVSPKKDVLSRTTSDIGMKPKKTSSPQRIKSKPEIQVSDMSTKGPKSQKPIIKEPHSKLPNKPKSATALNTSTDEDDIIVDVQQSKSSRENSPDRICPTPINFSDDVGTPRFPDEVSEPDDDFVKRTHHTIRETETLVDDIVEICEDEELFVKKINKQGVITDGDDSLLSVNDKVNKFTNKIHSVTKPKDVAAFKDTERRVHSDFVDENLKSDECLLTVSEKVNKFAKGQRDTKDSRSPSRKITDDYDKDTVYQDDYTKLSVNDKAHLFVETAENIKVTKVKPAQKVERLDISNVDESLKSDDCLLSVSDKVNKFVKTAETFLTDTQVYEETDKKIKEEHEKIIKQIVDDDEDDDDTFDRHEIINPQETHKPRVHPEYKSKPDSKEHQPSQPKVKDNSRPNSKPTERASTVKITTLRSSEAVKKAKALFENIASTQNTSHSTKASTKLTDIGVIRKSSKTDSTTALHPSVEVSPCVLDVDRCMSKSPMGPSIEVTTTKTVLSRYPASTRAESPRNRPESPVQRTEFPKQRTESPRQRTESPRQRTESPRQRPESEKPDKLPGYLRPTKTSQIKEEPRIEEPEVSTRRGSGKFGVELRRTSVERSTVSSERRRSVEHHQPCIEDIFDIELLEQMLEKVTGYEQRRRIRAQIRVAKHQSEHTSANTYTKTTKTTTTTTKTSSPERQSAKSPERTPKSAPQKTISPDRHGRLTPQKIHPDRSQPKESTPVINGHAREPEKTLAIQRPRSPEKPSSKSTLAPKTPNRQPSPDKKRPMSPSKGTPKPKSNRFNEYASAYMKKVGLNDSDQVKFTEAKTKKTTEAIQTVKHEKQETVQNFTTSKSFNERTSSKDVIESVQSNGKRSPSPEKRQSPDRKAQIPDRRNQSPERKIHSPARKPHSPERHTQSPDRIYQRSPSPDFKRPKVDTVKESIIKTVYEIDKKIPSKQAKEEKPSWVTNRNLKKITSESRTYSSKKIENEKPKYRAVSPSKVISKPIDVITSSYGPGPLDADGRPLFGIKALRNGGTNFQVKGTVIRQEFHSRNGGEPEGTVSVTAYSSQPEELEQLLAAQGAEPPSRIHGLSAITTTKKFGGDTGNTYSNVHTKEERASLEQFTHSDRKIDSRVESLETSGSFDRMDDTSDTRRIESRRDDKSGRTMKKEVRTELKRGKVEDRRERVEKREDKKTVRQSSVKTLTEKYIKSAHDSGKSDRTSYPKAGLILRTTTMRDSVSSDDAHPGLARADSEHSLGSAEDTVVTSTQRSADGVRTTTTRTTHHGPTVTHTRSSTVTHEPIVTKKTSTVIAHEPIITKKTTFITQEPVTHRMISQEPTITRKVIHEPVKVSQSRGTTTVTTERSFLDSDSKVTGVQDILTRMKNADIVIQEGDTEEDSEARALLNKFLGATVLMAGMQGYVAEQPEGKVTVRQETVRSTDGGKVSSSRSIEEFDLDNCWDERFLKKLLEECTDYEQRRRLRARIRTLMAEQEACASAVTEALGAAGASEGEGGETRGESLLLPLLQGLLGGGGERLLAGLGAAPADVVSDVRRSLGRLRAALAPPAAHPQARALLQLADRLEDALDAADRLDGCRRRPRRRSRANRHTVGVTHEELAAARRLVDAGDLALATAADEPASSATDAGDEAAPRRERNENGDVSYHAAVAARQRAPPVAHSVSYEPPRTTEAQAVERRAPAPRRPDYFRHSVADAAPQSQPRMDRRPSETKSSIAAIANKFDANAQMERRQQASASPRRAPVQRSPRPAKEEPQRSYFRPLPPTYNFAAPPTTQDDSKPLNRFGNNKKLRMKRANTIDIGRPLAGYRLDDSDEENAARPAPAVPEFRPQTENDRKFVAFMKKNEANDRDAAVVGRANWSSRFGNIKNAFESREREEPSRSSSTSSSSARRFWRAADEPGPRGRPFPAESAPEIIKPPWVTERREPARINASQIPRQAQPPRAPIIPPPVPIIPPPAPIIPPPAPLIPHHTTHPPTSLPAPPSYSGPISAPHPPPSPPTRPLLVKPFIARPIPVNQFSHAPMSAFKPPAKVASPTTAPPYIWSPPSLSATASPSTEHPPSFPPSPRPTATSPPPVLWQLAEVDKPREIAGPTEPDFQNNYEPIAPLPPIRVPAYDYPPHPQATHPQPTHAPPPTQNYPVKAIPSQNSLAAPELVRRVDEVNYPADLPKVDAQKLQIEFYERQIREKNRREPPQTRPAEPDNKPPAPPAYTVTDYTPSNGISTFVPLQRTPDIEKARAHKIDYLPDVVTNETDRLRSPLAPRAPPSPRSPRPQPAELPPAYRNGDAPYTNGTHEDPTTEHEIAVTRVMRGPVRGSATITAGVRTRNEPASAADALKGALDKVSSPKREAMVQIERKKREAPRSQVRAPVQNGRSPPSVPHVRPSPPSLGASRESIASSGSIASAGSGLSRSGSWHQLAVGAKATSPRRVVARTKSMHLLALPKMFEGGIAREEVTEKRRTVEAYFGGQPTTQTQTQTRSPPRARVRAAQYALGRSRTMSALTELQFLDESNADDAFEDLVSALA